MLLPSAVPCLDRNNYILLPTPFAMYVMSVYTIQELKAAVVGHTKVTEIATCMLHGDLVYHTLLPLAVPCLARNNYILLPTPFAM